MTESRSDDAGGDAPTRVPKTRRCAFCGADGPLTKEHVFGDWLSRLGLENEPVLHRAGALNRLPKDLGSGPMFARTVRSVCSSCNNGWMSQLERGAQQALGPLILGEPRDIAPDLRGLLALWAQKTVLVAMLVSSEEERANGYGLAQSEYHRLYKQRTQLCPLPASTVWIGRYTGQTRQAAVAVTPFVVDLNDLPEPDLPYGYAFTIALGQLIIHGARFTTPGMELDLATRQDMSQLWPPAEQCSWPMGIAVGDDGFLRFIAGKDIRVRDLDLRLSPWKPAASLPDSQVRGRAVELPAVCGKHVIYYPRALMEEAKRGHFYAFMASCPCEQAYLIHLEADAAHFRAAGTPEAVAAIYDKLPGEELLLEDDNGAFVCKRLVA